MKKKYLLITICTLTISVFSSDTKNEISNLGTMLLIHKTPTCGCCKEWVKHVKENGFNAHIQDHQSLLEIKKNITLTPNIDHVIQLCLQMVMCLKDTYQVNL